MLKMQTAGGLILLASVAGWLWAGQANTVTGVETAGSKANVSNRAATQPSVGQVTATQPASASTRPAASQPAALTTRPASPSVTVYYFHRTMRCPTCNRLEKLAKEAMEAEFAAEIEAGVLRFTSIDIQEKGNQHFEKDYALDGPSLILKCEGRQTQWKNMERIWDLVRDPAEYHKYVTAGVRDYLYHTAEK